MSLQIEINGTAVDPRDFSINHDRDGLSGTFNLTLGPKVEPGQTISIDWGNGKPEIAGIVSRVITSTAGPTSVEFIPPTAVSSYRRATGPIATGIVHRWTEDDLGVADSRIIRDFLTDSFARGFARNGIDT